ncbi:pyridoxal phosphate-dependent class II aminotransferase [Octadecabacter sp. G9-8]|uniref:Aminotransferase n=1 Tax=Octadecabacter dasysiphoniae TaxID=2909341 RepID=A0ABS9D063_9RHOB|nr:threonine-phosphate decarboxylase [Octadecabacter dasysiphoniae]MCF2871801.1 pyridoxal phosphate-dependent class II aminotransferase [Octadecabacter dasysiphoniae]
MAARGEGAFRVTPPTVAGVSKRDHGGGLDAAVAHYGGTRADWLDLSTGINPVPYPVGEMSADAWTALPDQGAMDRLLAAARAFWNVPDGAQIVAANGASALIAQMPRLADETDDSVYIPGPTYNEHAAAFRAAGFHIMERPEDEERVQVFVHPNNPTGAIKPIEAVTSRRLNIIDESFCDVMPDESHVKSAAQDGVIVLKSFGKFWGLAGARLGFAICAPDAAQVLRDGLGPWAVSGPALEIGAQALEDVAWADATRTRLAADAARLDQMVGWELVGGTDLFRTYAVPDAAAMQDKLAQGHVWSRIFPYSKTWIRLGLPAPDAWAQLEAAL